MPSNDESTSSDSALYRALMKALTEPATPQELRQARRQLKTWRWEKRSGGEVSITPKAKPPEDKPPR